MNKFESVRDQVFGLLDAELDSIILYLFVVGFKGLQSFENLLGHDGLCELQHAVETVVAQNGHDAWDDEAVNPSGAAVGNPLVENLVVVEQLSDNEVGSSVHLFLQVLDVVFA